MISDSPLVTVIIPSYNVSDYIDRAILSILNQTYTNLEIIIVDDASTDNTLSKIKAFEDKRIKIIHFEVNTKKIGAVNEALKQASGKLIAFQDADDWSEPTRIQEQVAAFNQNSKLGVCFTKYFNVYKSRTTSKRIALTDEELKMQFLNFGLVKDSKLAPTCCPSMMVSKEVVRSTGGYHQFFYGRVAEDIHWIYRILKKFDGIAIDKPLYNYTIREGSLTNLQLTGKNAKAAYTWQLLSKIIYKEIHENLDLLSPINHKELKAAELEACEEALIETIQLLQNTRVAYKTSISYKLGKSLLFPYHKLKKWVNLGSSTKSCR
jgi:glycosyltransferase involved in cell wall biosynthesis